MDRLNEKTYLALNITKGWLQDNGFYYNRVYSSSGTEVYSYRFPVHKSNHNNKVTLECEISITLGNPIVNIDVYEAKTYESYFPFYYCREHEGYRYLLNKIWGRIDLQMKKFGFVMDNKKSEISDNGKKKQKQKA